MILNVCVNYKGNYLNAFRFYEKQLNGKITSLTTVSVKALYSFSFGRAFYFILTKK